MFVNGSDELMSKKEEKNEDSEKENGRMMERGL